MPVDEGSRYRLHQSLEKAIGEREAETLMEHLPTGGWENVATKQDVLLVKQDLLMLKQDLLMVEARLDAKLADLRTHTLRTVLIANFALAMTVAGTVLAAARLG